MTKDEFIASLGFTSEPDAKEYFKRSLRIPTGLTGSCDFSTVDDKLRDMDRYFQDKHGKRIHIMGKMWMLNTNALTRGYLKTLWKKYFNDNRPTMVSDDYNCGDIYIERHQGQSLSLDSGHNLVLDVIYMNDSNTYKFQIGRSGLLERNTNEIITFRPNINTAIGIEYNGRKLMLPSFYHAPFAPFTDEQITWIKEWAEYAPRTKLELVRGKITKDGYCNLAFIVKTPGGLTIHLLSPAGLYFLSDIVMEYSGIVESDLEEWFSQASFRKIADRLIPAKRREVDTLRTQVENAKTNLSALIRDFTTAELAVNGVDNVQIVQDAFERMRAEAEREPLIKSISMDPDGKFKALIGNLKLSIYKDAKGSFVNSTAFDHKTGKKVEVPFGYVEIALDKNLIKSVFTGSVPYHPHLYTDGRLCTGNAGSLLSELIGKLNIVGAIKLYLSLLQKYNPGSPVNRLESIKSYENTLTSSSITTAVIEQFEKDVIGYNPDKNGDYTIYLSSALKEGAEAPKEVVRRRRSKVAEPLPNPVVVNQASIEALAREAEAVGLNPVIPEGVSLADALLDDLGINNQPPQDHIITPGRIIGTRRRGAGIVIPATPVDDAEPIDFAF